MEETIIIHDERSDSTIRFLNMLYEDKQQISIYDRSCSKSQIKKAIKENDMIWMLGHGNPYGLLSRFSKFRDFDRYLIDSTFVQFLREKNCIGIFCHANQFAEKYRLNGLFSGMIISEQDECDMCLGFEPTKEEIEYCNNLLVEALKDLFNNNALSEIPDLMKNYDRMEVNENTKRINDFNFKSFYFYGRGSK